MDLNSLVGGVRPPSPPKHDIMAPQEPLRARASIYLSSFFIINFSTRTCLSGSSLISLSLLGFRLGSSLFGMLFMKPFFFVNLISMSMLGFGLWPQVGPFPSQPILGTIREEGTPPTNPSRHLRKESSFLHLEWLLTEGGGRSLTAVRRRHRRTHPCRRRYRRHSFPRPRERRRCHRRCHRRCRTQMCRHRRSRR